MQRLDPEDPEGLELTMTATISWLKGLINTGPAKIISMYVAGAFPPGTSLARGPFGLHLSQYFELPLPGDLHSSFFAKGLNRMHKFPSLGRHKKWVRQQFALYVTFLLVPSLLEPFLRHSMTTT